MKNILIAGVGGQGVILASKVLMDVALKAGHDVKESEVHGMAQRGGSVECHVRFGEEVFSPLIPQGQADIVLSLELLESMRKLDYLAPQGKLIVNNLKIDPAPVVTGAMSYPGNIPGWLEKEVPGFQLIDTAPLLKEAGNKKVVNIVMLGVMSRYLEFPQELWHESLKELVKPEFADLNITAFGLGRAAAK